MEDKRDEKKDGEKKKEKPQHVTLEVQNLLHFVTTKIRGEEKRNG